MQVQPTPFSGTEKETLLAFLDNNRAIMVWKLEGLSAEDARRPMVDSGTSLIGLVKHLAWVERWWFDGFFAGSDYDYPYADDPEEDLRTEPGDTVAAVVDLYERHVALSNEIVAAHNLDTMSTGTVRGSSRSLRWVIGHMLEETARHAGHADIVRELIDGGTGYMPTT